MENPLYRLTDEQIEALAREFDELHEEVKADLGDRDAAYIRGIIDLQRRLALLGRALLFGSNSPPALVAGEEVGAALPFGCRMGICHTCVGRLCSGRVRDLRTGKVSGTEGEMVRTCINAPEGPVEIDL